MKSEDGRGGKLGHFEGSSQNINLQHNELSVVSCLETPVTQTANEAFT